MTLHALASGNLVADPQRREGTKGAFGTALLRVSADGGESVLVSIIAFNDLAERLLGLRRGDPASVAGRAELRAWTGKDGADRHGLSIVATEIAAARPRRQAEKRESAPRRRPPYRSQRPTGEPAEPRPFDDPIPF